MSLIAPQKLKYELYHKETQSPVRLMMVLLCGNKNNKLLSYTKTPASFHITATYSNCKILHKVKFKECRRIEKRNKERRNEYVKLSNRDSDFDWQKCCSATHCNKNKTWKQTVSLPVCFHTYNIIWYMDIALINKSLVVPQMWLGAL